jgi:hypothetical protein
MTSLIRNAAQPEIPEISDSGRNYFLKPRNIKNNKLLEVTFIFEETIYLAENNIHWQNSVKNLANLQLKKYG